MLIVRYNGKGHSSYGSSSDPSVLKVGQLYEVRILKVSAGLKLYELNGIEGTFLSMWFTRVGESYDTCDTQIWSRDKIPHHEDGWHRVF